VEGASDGGRAARRLTAAAVVALVVAGVVLRVWILRSPLGRADSDEAIVGIMARLLLHGEPHLFYLGQGYGGAQEAVLAAALFAVFGASTIALKLVPVALAAVGSVLVWRIGRRVTDSATAAIAGALTWAAPASYVWWSTKERGFYGATLVLCLVVVLYALRLADRPDRRDAAVLGAAAGFAWYASPQSAYVIVPVLGWLVAHWIRARRRDALLLWWPAGLGLLVGAAPWLVGSIRNHWASLDQPPAAVATSYPERLRIFARVGLPILTGLRAPVAAHWLWPGFQIVYVVVMAALVWVCVRHRVHALLLTVLVAYPLLLAVARTSYFQYDTRYLYALSPLLILAFLAALPARPVVPVVVAAVVLALSFGGLGSLTRWSRADIGTVDLGPVIRVLRAEHVRYAFGSYWVVYRIDFETDGRVVATPFGPPRYWPSERRVRAADRPAYVVALGTEADRTFPAALRARDVAFRRFEAGSYAVYLPARTIHPEDVPSVRW
jgi:hypothetical protein